MSEAVVMQPVVADNVVLHGLKIELGPELRATYPVVMNFEISGDVVIDGPADVSRLKMVGVIRLDGGEVSRVTVTSWDLESRGRGVGGKDRFLRQICLA